MVRKQSQATDSHCEILYHNNDASGIQSFRLCDFDIRMNRLL